MAPADTTLPGSGRTIHSNLLDYLGPTPLFFDIEQTVAAGARMTVELTYVQLLPMIVAGRYAEAAPMEVTLSGTAFGQPVSFSYDLALADSNVTA